MSRKIEDLTAHTAMLAEKIKEYCESKNVKMLIYSTRRSFAEQARLFRKGRSHIEIRNRVDQLASSGYDLCAKAIENVGPQIGDHVTNAAPGESWHNFGMAFDAVPVDENNEALWDYPANKDKWDVYAEAIYTHGMIWGGNFESFKDYPHAQLMDGHPLRKLSKANIEKAAEWNEKKTS